MNDLSKRFADQIRDTRQDLGISQRELARRIGTTQATICRWEAGDHAPPVRSWQDIAAALHTTVGDLFATEEVA